MRISDMIARLTALLNTEGDLYVAVSTYDGYDVLRDAEIEKRISDDGRVYAEVVGRGEF